jgi:transposase
MVPRHEGAGGKARLGGISKRGDVYLRTMLIHGARTVVAQLERKRDASDGWLHKLVARRNKNIAAVALAAKNARIAWAVFANGRSYQRGYVAEHAVAA